jgi:hypothetical protein
MLIVSVFVWSWRWCVPEFGEVADLIQRILPQVAVGNCSWERRRLAGILLFC